MFRVRLESLPQSLLARELILVGGLVVLAIGLAPWAYSRGQEAGLRAEASALALCLLPFAAALAVSHWARQSHRVLVGMVLAMTLRTGFPLVLLIALHHHGGLDRDGLLYYVLTFYFVALLIETPLSLSRSVQTPAKIV